MGQYGQPPLATAGLLVLVSFAFDALPLLIRWQEGHPAYKI